MDIDRFVPQRIVETFRRNVSTNPSQHPTTMTLYKNKYRIESARLSGWDYASNGCYFITICTHDRQHFFGDIQQGKMYLSAIGEIVADEW